MSTEQQIQIAIAQADLAITKSMPVIEGIGKAILVWIVAYAVVQFLFIVAQSVVFLHDIRSDSKSHGKKSEQKRRDSDGAKIHHD